MEREASILGTKPQIQKIIFIPNTEPSRILMYELAVRFVRNHREVYMVLNRTQIRWLSDRVLSYIEKSGIRFLDFSDLSGIDISGIGKKVKSEPYECQNKSKNFFYRLLNSHDSKLKKRSDSVSIISSAIILYARILRLKRTWRPKIKSMGFTHAFTWGDNAGSTMGALLDELKLGKAKIVNLPIAMTEQFIIAELRINNSLFEASIQQSLIHSLISKFLPGQVLPYKGKRLLYFLPSEVIAHLLLGSKTRAPWILGACRADTVCLSTRFEANYWVNKGLSTGKIYITGFMQRSLESNIKAFRDQVDRTGLLSSKKRIILVNLPNNIEHGVTKDWHVFWRDVQRILEPLQANDIRLVISLHPKCDRRQYEWLEGVYNCDVFTGGIFDLISIADIYISAASTTELMSATQEKETLDIGQIWGFRSEILSQCRSIKFVDTFELYDIEVKSMLSSLRRRKVASKNIYIESVSHEDTLRKLEEVLFL